MKIWKKKAEVVHLEPTWALTGGEGYGEWLWDGRPVEAERYLMSWTA
jgi:hypothetical protein